MSLNLMSVWPPFLSHSAVRTSQRTQHSRTLRWLVTTSLVHTTHCYDHCLLTFSTEYHLIQRAELHTVTHKMFIGLVSTPTFTALLLRVLLGTSGIKRVVYCHSYYVTNNNTYQFNYSPIQA